MHALARERIEVDRQGGDQRLAFAGAHFGDHGAVQDHAAHHLHVEMALLQGALGGFAHGGEGVDQDVVQALAGSQAAFEPVGAPAHVDVVQGSDFRFLGVDLIDDGAEGLDQPVVTGAEKAFGESAEHLDLEIDE